MKNIFVRYILLYIMVLASAVLPANAVSRVETGNTRVQGHVECSFLGCVHDGGDAVLIFNIGNRGGEAALCRLGHPQRDPLHVVGGNGQVFHDLDCYVDTKVVATEDETREFLIPAGSQKRVSIVVHNVPSRIVRFSDFDLPVQFDGEASKLFHYDNIPVTTESAAKKVEEVKKRK
ncbi:MAG: hypothetical protein NC036_06930 [Muribaculaceae bacterium]|nr:hypothetical protein [Muribaculaceae bacterium]